MLYEVALQAERRALKDLSVGRTEWRVFPKSLGDEGDSLRFGLMGGRFVREEQIRYDKIESKACCDEWLVPEPGHGRSSGPMVATNRDKNLRFRRLPFEGPGCWLSLLLEGSA